METLLAHTTLPYVNYQLLITAIANLNKKAKRLKLAPVELRLIREFTITEKNSFGLEVERERYEVEVLGEAPRIPGWVIIGKIEHDGDVAIVKSAPGRELSTSWQNATSTCGHCKTKRQRKETVILTDGTAEIQVGKACLKDFVDDLSIYKAVDFFFEVAACLRDEDMCFGGCAPPAAGTAEFINTCAAHVQRNGWVPRSMSGIQGKVTTASAAWSQLFPPYSPGSAGYDSWAHYCVAEVDSRAEELGARAMAWASSISDSEAMGSNFMHNLRALVRRESVDHRGVGIVAAVIPCYERTVKAQIALLEQAKADAGRMNEHFGEIKKRYDLSLEVEAVFDRESDWGSTHITKMKDSDGRRFVWFSSSTRLDVGDKVELRGTVKAHNEFRGNLETVLTRCQASDVVSLPTPEPEAEPEADAEDVAQAKKAGAAMAPLVERGTFTSEECLELLGKAFKEDRLLDIAVKAYREVRNPQMEKAA